jgi:hypothetical protein
MKRRSNELIVHGAVGGILGGLIVALWFLVVDTLTFRPFLTPAALAAALYHVPFPGHPTVQLVLMYSLVHFGVFAILGIVAALAMAAMQLQPRLVYGVIFGIVVQEALFYTGLFLSGSPPSEVISWLHVAAANILSGLVIMAYLHRTLHAPEPLGFAVLKRYPQLSRGLVTGLLGAVTVAVWFFLLDIATGRPFATPGALGSALLFGASNAEGAVVNLGVVAAYTVVHLLAFSVAGFVFVMMAEKVESSPSLLLLAVLTLIVLEGVVVGALALGAQWVLGGLGVWSVLVGNLLAVVSMGWYVLQTHPTLRHKLFHEPVNVRV